MKKWNGGDMRNDLESFGPIVFMSYRCFFCVQYCIDIHEHIFQALSTRNG